MQDGGAAAHLVAEDRRYRVPNIFTLNKLHYYFGLDRINKMHKRRRDTGGLGCGHEVGLMDCPVLPDRRVQLLMPIWLGSSYFGDCLFAAPFYKIDVCLRTPFHQPWLQ